MAHAGLAEPMARKRKPDESSGSLPPEQSSGDVEYTVISIRVTREFHEWAKGLAKRDRRAMPDEIAFLFEERAKVLGYEAPPDRL